MTRSRLRPFFGLVFGIFATLVSSSALAADSSVAQAASPAGPSQSFAKSALPWADKSYEDCGQSCMYLKANENIELQAYYLVNKLQWLQQQKDDGNDDKIQDSLKGFCLSSESASDCFDRYKQLQVIGLKKMRSAIVQNSDSASRLKRKDEPMYAFDPGKDPKKQQIPYVVTFEDLKKKYRPLSAMTSEDYRSVFKPSLDEFVQFTKIPRDPDNPKGGYFTVVKRDSSGNPVYDTKAYQKALKNYLAVSGDLQKMNAARPKVPPRDLESATSEDNRQLFNESRKDIIETVNSSLNTKIQSVGVMEFKPAERKPATGKEKVADPKLDPPGQSRFETFDMDVGGDSGKHDPKAFNLQQEIDNLEK